MKTTRLLALFALGCAAALADTTDVPRLPAGITTLVMASDVGNGFAPPAPGSRVTVPYYEEVRMRAPEGWAYPIQWTKNDKPITGATEPVLTLRFVTQADSGTYQIAGAPFPFITTGIKLEVAAAGHVGNFSARLELAPGDGAQVVGFVVSGRGPKSLLLRAVGPSLRAYGVEKPAALPRMRFFDAAGKELVFAYPAVIIDWAPIFASAGAFPLTGGERERVAFTTLGLAPGAYSVHVSDDAGLGGTVLLEVYELPW